MFKTRNLISIFVIIVVGILVYNRFLGTPEEQESAKNTFQTIGKAFKDVGGAVGNLLKSEKEKFDEGKYDKALDNVKDWFNKANDKIQDLGEKKDDYLDKINRLQEQKKALEDKIALVKGKEMTEEESMNENEDLKGDLSKLVDELNQVMEEVGVDRE